VLRSAPRVRILATSREPLRAEGEWSHRLASLHPPVPVDVELAARFPRRITDGSGFIGWPSRAVSLATNALASAAQFLHAGTYPYLGFMYPTLMFGGP
jgi:predicted ATPase